MTSSCFVVSPAALQLDFAIFLVAAALAFLAPVLAGIGVWWFITRKDEKRDSH